MPADTPSASFILIVAFICITLGYIFGWIVSSSQRNKGEKKSSEDARDPNDVVAAEPKAPAATEQPKTDRAALFRLLRDAENDRWIVETGGKAFTSPDELTLDDRRRVEAALRATADWMGLAYQLGTPSSAKPVQPAAQPEEPQLAPVSASVADEQLRPTKVLSDMTGALADALQPTTKKEAPKSIVEQIDLIFQAKLAGTEYEGKKVYIAEDPRRGVIVRVGDKVYEGVGSLPEGDVKTMLRSAVTEWERQQEQRTRRTA